MYADTTAVILAGGQGQRIAGQDKGLLVYQGKPLIEHAIDALKPFYKNIIVSANRNQDVYQQYTFPVVVDTAYKSKQEHKGPLAGIEASMKAASTPYIMVCACDIVNLPEDLFKSLQSRKVAADITIARDAVREQYLLSIWKTTLLSDIADAINNNELAVYKFLQKHHAQYVSFTDAQWVNINSEE